MNSTSEGVFVLNKNKQLIFCNEKFKNITGLDTSIKNLVPTMVEGGWHNDNFYQKMWQLINENGYWEDEVWDIHGANKSLYVMNQKIIRFGAITKSKYLGIITDITSQLKAQQELSYLEKIDQSTNVANRFFGEKKLKEFLEEKRKNVAIVLLDVNNFSLISNTFGHTQGDKVLKIIANRLKKSIDGDQIFSFGTDRFVMYFSYEDNDHIESTAFSIIDQFYEPFIINGNDFFLSVNLGISLYLKNGIDPEELIRNADSAMLESRKEDTNRFCFYESQMNDSIVEQFQFIGDLRKSIEREELSMAYHPQVDSSINRVVGAEALLRWISKDRGYISPAKFIPVAEKKGLMTPLGEWVLRSCCDNFTKWKEFGINDSSMSINISAVQFNDKNLVPIIKNIFYNRVDTSLIELEITESSVIDDVDLAIKTMYNLKDMGFRLAIDDFGIGFSSLSYLKKFPIDKLKIDKSFIDSILEESGSVAIVKSIISLADNLDLKVISEGVETKEQLDLVKNLGCPLIQGYYYSEPLTLDKFIKFHRELNNN